MTPELWERLKPLFHAAVETPEGERKAFIDQICGDDAELRREFDFVIIDAPPEQLKLPFHLWTRAALVNLIEREYGIAVGERTDDSASLIERRLAQGSSAARAQKRRS